ncbi:DUF2583 family protein [Morganella morganii]|uniref:DUF2583 family protein n=1 Tax=Morganella morganii TaxID=582 RepID=UPI001D143421|nr:DUF2583 family protein [Morganella morganii]
MLPEFYSEAPLMGIVVGALWWLGGAGLSGRRDSIEDKYYWLRHFHSRYRRRMP